MPYMSGDNLLTNDRAGQRLDIGAPSTDALRFHRGLPGYEPAPLVYAGNLASSLGLDTLLVKDESNRFGLPAFKVLGASWAVYRLLSERAGLGHAPEGFGGLRRLLARTRSAPAALVTATDGNHGRGVARVASWLGVPARVFMPRGSAAARIEAIESEGAEVTVVDGDYEEAVRAAAACAKGDALLVQDTAFPGYEEIPRLVVEGYSTIFHEIEEQLAELEAPEPELVVVQVGVGSLAAAAVGHFRHRSRERVPLIAAAEPFQARCAFESVREGRPVVVPGPHGSVMAGLACGTISTIAWPLLRDGVDLFVLVGEDEALCAVRDLYGDGIVSGESGAAGAAALRVLLGAASRAGKGRMAGLERISTALVISTEGVTDPRMHQRAMRR